MFPESVAECYRCTHADEEGLMRADIAAFGGNYEQLESIYASILRPLSDHS